MSTSLPPPTPPSGLCSEERLQRVMDEIESREKRLQQSKELLQRFKKATNR